jgi:hypothetical protein
VKGNGEIIGVCDRMSFTTALRGLAKRLGTSAKQRVGHNDIDSMGVSSYLMLISVS